MKIAIDASRANKDEKTGIEWYSYFLIQEFKKIASDFEITLYSFDELKGDLANFPRRWTSKVLKLPFKYIWTHIRLSLEVLINPPDILFIPAHNTPLFIRKKTKLFATIHDLGFEDFPQYYHPLSLLYHRLSVRLTKRKAEKIFTISEFTKSKLIEYFNIPEEKIVVIPLGYDAEQYNTHYSPQVINETLEKFNISKPYLLYVGRLEKKKNSERLIEAFAKVHEKHPELQLVVPGTIGHGYKELHTKIDQLEIKDLVKELGYVSSCKVAALYSGAEAFVFPSLYEGFGIPVLEAMACGTPVVASKIASIPEVGGEAIHYFDPLDIEDISQNVLEVLEDGELRASLIEKGLERVKKFSWEKTAKRTWEIFFS